MGPEHIFLTVLHGVILVSFAALVVFAARRVFKRRNTYNAWLLSFAYLSLGSWILWVLQYLMLLAHPLISPPTNILQNAILWLGVMQNVLWASAILSLYSKHLSRVPLILPLLAIISTIVGLIIGYQPAIVTSFPVVIIAGVSAAAIFTALAISILQLPVSKILAATFFIYGYFQWFWHYLGFTSLSQTQSTLLAYSIWHLALLGAWISLISEMLVRFRVMISSTKDDLVEERLAVDRALQKLDLQGFRSEVFGSRPETPEAICASRAEQCHIFILITGESYGPILESNNLSQLEFEYQIARNHDRGKILVYIKDGVTREPRLEEFVKRLRDSRRGHSPGSFSRAEELSEMILRDVADWVKERREKITSQHWT